MTGKFRALCPALPVRARLTLTLVAVWPAGERIDMKKRIRIAAAGCALALSIVGLAAAPAAAAPPWYQTNAASCVRGLRNN